MIKTISLDKLLQMTGLTKAYGCGYMCIVEEMACVKHEQSYATTEKTLKSVFDDRYLFETEDLAKKALICDHQPALYEATQEIIEARNKLNSFILWMSNVFPSLSQLLKSIDKANKKIRLESDRVRKLGSQHIHTIKLPKEVTCVALMPEQELYVLEAGKLLAGSSAISKVTIKNIELVENFTAESNKIPLNVKVDFGDRDRNNESFIAYPENGSVICGEISIDNSDYRVFVDKDAALSVTNQIKNAAEVIS